MALNKIIFLFAFVWLLTSCNSKPYYEEYIEIPVSGWHEDSVAQFKLKVDDTISDFLVGINLRNNNQYPFSNIYLFREIYSPKGLEFRDTMEFFLADAYGQWLGKGVGELKTNQWQFASRGLRFKKRGTYTFTLTQAMREENLIGVEDVGITIFKSDSKKEE